MGIKKWMTLSFIKAFGLIFLLFGVVLTPVSFANDAPQNLYDQVWQLIRKEYVDPKTNGQDWLIWRHRYDRAMANKSDSYEAIKTMLASLNDRYTRLLPPDEFSEEKSSIKSTLYGIGVVIGPEKNDLVIISPIEGSPADKAGLKAHDRILKINGQSTQGMTIQDASQQIRGKKGTQVKLLVKRDNLPPKVYAVMRDEIKIKSVSVNPPLPIKSNIGYIRLNSFLSQNASIEVKKALEKEGKKQGYILDLRDNPGGLLINAAIIANYFYDQGDIVSTVDRDGYEETITAGPGFLVTHKPLVVLINGGSASASEILSGALRDNNRAILVGEKSYGKGLVQEINPLSGGAGVNITTAKYLTPDGTDINKIGILPDIQVKMPDEGYGQAHGAKQDADPQLVTAEAVLEQMIAGKSTQYLQSRSLIQKGNNYQYPNLKNEANSTNSVRSQ